MTSEPLRPLTDSPKIPRRWILVGLFLFGGSTALTQNGLLREVLTTFHGTEIAVGAFYGAWFIWIALGALTGPRLARKLMGHERFFIVCQLLLPLALFVQLLFLRYTRVVFRISPLDLVSLELLLFCAFLGTSLPGLLVGAMFPSAGAILKGDGPEPVSLVYGLEAFGSLAGGLLFSFVVATRYDPITALAFVGLASAVVAGIGAFYLSSKPFYLAAGGTVLLSILLLGAGASLDRIWERARFGSLQRGFRLVATRYTPYTHIVLGATKGSVKADQEAVIHYGLFLDGVQTTYFPDPRRYAELAAHAMAIHPSAQRILLLGAGPEGLAQQLLSYPSIKSVVAVYQDPWALHLIRKHLPAHDRRSLDDPRVNVLVRDGRQWINEGAGGKRFDLVLSAVPLPTTASMNRYFTRQFFSAVQRVMDKGVFMLLFHRDEVTTLSVQEKQVLSSIFHTMSKVFPAVRVSSGDLHYMTAFTRPEDAVVSPMALLQRYRSLRLERFPFPPKGVPDGIDQEHSTELEKALLAVRGDLNTDSRPRTYYYGMLYLGRLSRSRLPSVLEAIRRAGSAPLFIIPWLLVALLVLRQKVDPDQKRAGRANSAWAVGTVGFASMSFMVVILLAHQSRLGSLYQQMGALSGAFMAGLASGAFAGRALRRRLGSTGVLLLGALVAVAVMAAVLPLLIASLGRLNGMSGIMAHMALLAVTGILTGSIFPLAASGFDPANERVVETASVLDASDHIGACLGGFLAGVFLLPVFGLEQTCLLIAAAAGSAAALSGSTILMARMGKAAKSSAGKARVFPPLDASFRLAMVCLPLFVLFFFIHSGKAKESSSTSMTTISSTALRPELALAASREGVKLEEQALPFHHVRVTKGGALDEIIFSTKKLASEIRGYAGPIELIVRMGADGTIRSVRMGEHNETPSYISRIPSWLNRFQGIKLFEPLIGPRSVDAVSSATVTSEAIKQILHISRQKAMEQVLKVASSRSSKGPSKVASLLSDPRAWVIVAFFGFALAAYLVATPLLRFLSLLLGAGVLGLWLNLPFSLVDLGFLTIFTLSGSMLKWIVVICALLLAVLLGQVYCGYICPFGAMQELVWLPYSRGGWDASNGMAQARLADGRLEVKARYTKFLMLALALTCFWITRDQVFLLFDPMVWAFRPRASFFELSFLALVLLASLLLFRPFCRYLCPVGALLALMNKLSFLDRWASRRRINRCDLGVTSYHHVDCIRCNRCVKPRGERAARQQTEDRR